MTRSYIAIGHGFTHGEMGLAWSPDGTRLVFAAGAEFGRLNLYVIDADGGSPEERITSGAGTSFAATWSPDGQRIAYIAGEPLSHGNVMVANADGSDQKRLIDEKVFYLPPQWSPDGTMIVVQPAIADAGIWLVDSGTGTVRAKLSFTPAVYEDDVPGGADIWSFERVLP